MSELNYMDCWNFVAPREVRYDIKIVTRDGKQHKL